MYGHTSIIGSNGITSAFARSYMRFLVLVFTSYKVVDKKELEKREKNGKEKKRSEVYYDLNARLLQR